MRDTNNRAALAEILVLFSKRLAIVQGEYNANMKLSEVQRHAEEAQEAAVKALSALLRQAEREAAEQAEIKAEIKGKILALDKLIMGAGEYHDDPYEYVIRLSDARQYRSDLMKFDLSQPIFRDDAALVALQVGQEQGSGEDLGATTCLRVSS